MRLAFVIYMITIVGTAFADGTRCEQIHSNGHYIIYLVDQGKTALVKNDNMYRGKLQTKSPEKLSFKAESDRKKVYSMNYYGAQYVYAVYNHDGSIVLEVAQKDGKKRTDGWNKNCRKMTEEEVQYVISSSG